MSNASLNLSKEHIKSFLEGFQRYIGERVADRDNVERTVRNCAKKTKGGTNWEEAFVLEFVLKNVHAYLAENERGILGGKKPHELILAESVSAKKALSIACGTPAKESGHPFNKALGADHRELYMRWSGKDRRGRKAPFAPVCPDLALLAPYRVVFECKYFNQNAIPPALSQLVEGIYQAFFYRAVPTFAPGTAGLKFGWEYEYSCFLAYDATPKRRLAVPWFDLNEEVRQRFWSEGNIFVMILPCP